MKMLEWIAEQREFSEHLSKRENWNPMLKHIARLFLITGGILGCIMGTCLGILLSML